jgi:cytochrome c peroxidase
MQLFPPNAVPPVSSLSRTGPSSSIQWPKLVAIVSATTLLIGSAIVVAQSAGTDLKPPLPDLTGIVKNKEVAIALGKALFWDEQAGSDGMSCGSCHFHAGADSRIANPLSPGLLDLTKNNGAGDTQFGSEHSDTAAVAPGEMPSGAPAGSNYTLTPQDMPLHRLADETNRDSDIVTTTNDRVSSAGAYAATFNQVPFPFTRIRVRGSRAPENCNDLSADVFHAGGLPARQVEPRNTPTVFNAVFNHTNFWDGRANNTFNGVGVFGMRDILGDPAKRLVVLNGDGSLKLDFLQLENASLASQAVGPPLSALEMSCADRTFADIARRLLSRTLKPLRNQAVSPNDSVLSPFADPSGRGLKRQHGYEALIRQAFDEKYWAAPGFFRITKDGRLEQVNPVNTRNEDGYTQMELNFPMFWGIAIMLYESTLISNQSEFDRRVAAGELRVFDTDNPNPQGPPFGCTGTKGDLVERGCALFFSPRNGCLFCHGGKDLFSTAALQQGEPFPALIQVPNALTPPGGLPDTHDAGFFSVGLRPVYSDIMNGGTDPYGNPLSATRQYKKYLATGNLNDLIDPYLRKQVEDTGDTDGDGKPDLGLQTPVTKVGTDGTAKAPSMRNVALTPPYFSWGGYASLRQVLKFYNRGGNRRLITGSGDPDAHGASCTTGDDTGTGADGEDKHPVSGQDCSSNTSGAIRSLGLRDCDANGVVTCDTSTDDLAALEAFLKSLSDPRVQCDQAPFDHPSLHVRHGHRSQDANRDGRADDIVFELPTVGANGYAPSSGLCVPNAGDLFAPGMQARTGGARVPLR